MHVKGFARVGGCHRIITVAEILDIPFLVVARAYGPQVDICVVFFGHGFHVYAEVVVFGTADVVVAVLDGLRAVHSNKFPLLGITRIAAPAADVCSIGNLGAIYVEE